MLLKLDFLIVSGDLHKKRIIPLAFILNSNCTCIAGLLEPAVLIEGVLFRAKYLGSTQLVCEGQPTKTTRMMQAEEAVSRIKVILRLINLYRIDLF